MPNGASSSEQVFFSFDHHAIPFRHGLQLKMLPFSPAVESPANTVLRPGAAGAPDEKGVRYHGTVLEVNGEWWMWYLGQSESADRSIELRICLARSTDGRNWIKPDLGLVQFRGSTANNLVALSSDGFRAGGCLVFHEPDAEEPRRFKMLFVSAKYGTKFAVAYSPDGVSWTESLRNPRGPFFEPAGATKLTASTTSTGRPTMPTSPPACGSSSRTSPTILSTGPRLPVSAFVATPSRRDR